MWINYVHNGKKTQCFWKINQTNELLLVFKYYVYRSREKHLLNKDILLDNLIEINKKEKQVSLVHNNKTKIYNKNWCVAYTVFQLT